MDHELASVQVETKSNLLTATRGAFSWPLHVVALIYIHDARAISNGTCDYHWCVEHTLSTIDSVVYEWIFEST